jgi:hypothetical protein
MERLADRYDVGDALGQGRSTVYRAVDTRLRRQVAIKRVALLSGAEDVEQVRTRALREAQASARLNNPSAVAVYDVVEEDGAIWLVMELVDGPSLARVVEDDGPLPHQRTAAIGFRVLDALEAAHLVGVVHRDVKPANVLVPAGDRAKLTDFGVATIRDESRVTATGLIVGSPSYMAPEQATGGDITAATDLWSLGALLYFAVEGVPPFQEATALATATAVVHADPRPPERPGPVHALVARLLVRDPAGRASAGEVRMALSRVAREEGPRPAPDEPAATARPARPPVPPAVLDAPTAVAATPAAPGDPEPAATWGAPAREAVAEAAVAPGRSPLDVAASTAAASLGTALTRRRGRPQEQPAPAPAGGTPARRPSDASTSRSPTVLLVLGALLLVLAAVIAVPALTSDAGDGTASRDTPPSESGADGQEDAATDGDDTGDGGAPDTTAPPTTAPATSNVASELPAGWSSYRDPQGAYTIGLPPGWRVEPTGNATRVDLVDPATGTFLRIEWTGEPGEDPVQAWRELASAFASRNANYRQLGIDPVAYRDYDAALWEFTHESGPTLHTGNLGFVTAGRGYALMLRTPDELWASSQDLFEQFKQAFQPL